MVSENNGMVNMDGQGWVKTTMSAGVCRIRFFHPKSNSLPGRILSELAKTVSALRSDDAVKVVVLESEGEGAFCAGASFDELRLIRTPEEGLQFFMGFARVILAMRSIPQIVIGRIQGKAVGGGVGLAAACDYAIATKQAAIKLSELAVGIGPFVVGPVIERKIGVGPMSALALDTDWRDATWAGSKGLYSQLVEDIPALDTAVHTLAERLSRSNGEALRSLKENFWRGTEELEKLLPERAAISGQLILSEHSKQALAAFSK